MAGGRQASRIVGHVTLDQLRLARGPAGHDILPPHVHVSGPIAREDDAATVGRPERQVVVRLVLDQCELLAPVGGQNEDVELPCIGIRIQVVSDEAAVGRKTHVARPAPTEALQNASRSVGWGQQNDLSGSVGPLHGRQDRRSIGRPVEQLQPAELGIPVDQNAPTTPVHRDDPHLQRLVRRMPPCVDDLAVVGGYERVIGEAHRPFACNQHTGLARRQLTHCEVAGAVLTPDCVGIVAPVSGDPAKIRECSRSLPDPPYSRP